MISSFHIGNFKSYRDAHLPLAPLTLLIGANASGKSNAIEAIRLLAILADGRRLEDLVAVIQSSDEFIRGSVADLPRDSEEPIEIGCKIEGLTWSRLEISLHVDRARMGIEDEYVTDSTAHEKLYQFLPSSPSGSAVAVHDVAASEEKGSVPVLNQQAIFTQLESPARFAPGSRGEQEIPRVARAFRESIDQIRFFDLQPRRMRGYSYIGHGGLNEDGSNLSAVLSDIVGSREAGREVLQFLEHLPEQSFTGIGFIVTERGDVMVRLSESFGNRKAVRDAPVLSDGTLRVLGIAAALFSAEPGSTIVIEEIDNGVHPSRAETLLRNIERVAKERDLRVLLTTHNPALLDRLPTEAIPHVVCAYRDPDEGDSRLVRLEDLPSYPELIARGPLGQLMTRGVLDYFLKHQRSPEEKEEQTQRWLETLKAQVGDA